MNQPILNNRYRIIKTLASGGFGETFLAQDTQMPSGRLCVIKQLKPIVNNPQIYQLVQERFQREAAILEELGETNNQIPRLYAYFTENAQFYLVQEWIEGETLTKKLQSEGVFNENFVRQILVSLLPVLEYVHSKRIIHRDIKPGNIIWRERDDLPVLIDFGAVKELMGTTFNSKGNPSRSIVIGTPGFMPPEQAAGHPVYASDIYSLGLTIIYLLTGKNPSQLPTNSPWENLTTNITPQLTEILNKVIQPNPSDRYSTAKEMLHALKFGPTAMAPTVPSPPPPILLPVSEAPKPAPTLVTSPPPEALSPSQPIVSNPPTLKPNASQMGDWQKAIITGSIIGGFILIGIVLVNSIFTDQYPEKVEPSTTNTNPNQVTSPSPIPKTSTKSQKPQPSPRKTENSITETEVAKLIETWLEAKAKMFSPPYNSQIANELTTGDFYEKIAGVNGSINWLKNNNAYYKYGVQRLDSIEQFFANNDSATIKVRITEEYSLYRNGKIDPNETDFKTLTIIYNLKLIDGQWKISNSRTL
ncbi:protein kinase domain-containing protein [Dapis sp. BLCC M126]|uniref:protein kinase domain-containing protein n=1 Tax=Dapis sp. BLCC M126 TaxID=3400189 RepID=UPI003CFA446A